MISRVSNCLPLTDIQSKLPAAWKAVSAKLTKKKDTGIMSVVKAAMAAKKQPQPVVKKVDTRYVGGMLTK